MDSVFATTDQSKQQKKANGKNSEDATKKLPTRECRICPKRIPSEDKKHWEADCPYLERFHQSMEQETKPKKHTTFTSIANDCDSNNDDENDSAWVTLSATVVAAVANGQLGPRDISSNHSLCHKCRAASAAATSRLVYSSLFWSAVAA